jgi:hypothetical protein
MQTVRPFFIGHSKAMGGFPSPVVGRKGRKVSGGSSPYIAADYYFVTGNEFSDTGCADGPPNFSAMCLPGTQLNAAYAVNPLFANGSTCIVFDLFGDGSGAVNGIDVFAVASPDYATCYAYYD